MNYLTMRYAALGAVMSIFINTAHVIYALCGGTRKS